MKIPFYQWDHSAHPCPERSCRNSRRVCEPGGIAVISLVLAGLIIINPQDVLALLMVIMGVVALVLGVMLLVNGIRLKRRMESP